MGPLTREILTALVVAVLSGSAFAFLYGRLMGRSRPADVVTEAVEAEMGMWLHIWRGVGFGLLFGGISFLQSLVDAGKLGAGTGWALIALLFLVSLSDVPFMRAYRACLKRALEAQKLGSNGTSTT